MPRLTAFLPLRTSGDHYDENIARTKILLKSLSTFWHGLESLELSIAVRPDEIELVKSSILEWPQIEIKVIDENAMLDGITSVGARGWHKQQALKLAAVSQAENEFTLILDPDVVCCRPISAEILLPGGKALTEWEARNLHRPWWVQSAHILGVEIGFDRLGLSVTPQILSKTIAGAVQRRLEERHPAPWWRYLLSDDSLSGDKSWTEYSLCCLEGERNGAIRELHWERHEQPKRLHTGGSLWFAKQLESWSPEKYFTENSDGYFFVCQSSSGIRPEIISSRLKGLI